MGERAEQLVLEYLGRVADAAHGVLRSDHRVAFVARLRTRIDELRAGATDPNEVRKVIARFGDPATLVERERARLEREAADLHAPDRPPSGMPAPERPAAGRPAIGEVPLGQPAPERHAAGRPPPPEAPPMPADESSTEPIPVVRPVDEVREPPEGWREQGWRERGVSEVPGPIDDAPPPGGRPAQRDARHPPPPPASPAEPARPPAGPLPESAPPSAGPPAAGPPAEPAADPRVQPSAWQAAEAGTPGRHGAGHIRPVPGRPSTPQARPAHSGLPLYEPPSPRRDRADVSLLGSRLLTSLPAEVRAGLRSRVLAPIAVAVLGVGGLLLPFPLWLVGAALVLLSTEWPRGHKIVGLLMPVVFVLGGAGGLASVDEARAGAAAYGHALAADGIDLFRVGAAVGAAFLAWRVVLNSRSPDPPRWREVRGERTGRTRGFR